jgi:hypothetical protein
VPVGGLADGQAHVRAPVIVDAGDEPVEADPAELLDQAPVIDVTVAGVDQSQTVEGLGADRVGLTGPRGGDRVERPGQGVRVEFVDLDGGTDRGEPARRAFEALGDLRALDVPAVLRGDVMDADGPLLAATRDSR